MRRRGRGSRSRERRRRRRRWGRGPGRSDRLHRRGLEAAPALPGACTRSVMRRWRFDAEIAEFQAIFTFCVPCKGFGPVFACSLLEAFKVVLHIPRSQGFCCNDPPSRFAHLMLLGAQNEKNAYFERILLLKRRGAHRRPCAKGGMRAHARRVLLARGPAARERARALVVYWYTR